MCKCYEGLFWRCYGELMVTLIMWFLGAASAVTSSISWWPECLCESTLAAVPCPPCSAECLMNIPH